MDDGKIPIGNYLDIQNWSLNIDKANSSNLSILLIFCHQSILKRCEKYTELYFLVFLFCFVCISYKLLLKITELSKHLILTLKLINYSNSFETIFPNQCHYSNTMVIWKISFKTNFSENFATTLTLWKHKWIFFILIKPEMNGSTR